MPIPHADRAVIDPVKLHGYLLSRSHRVGRFKAAFFLALGYSSGAWRVLEADLRSQHLTQESADEVRTTYGQKYTIRARLVGPTGESAEVARGGRQMTYRVLDAVVLVRDIPDHGLRQGDLGAVVEVYQPDSLEVEFVTASGRTTAVLTLNARDVRPVSDEDLVAVRPRRRSA